MLPAFFSAQIALGGGIAYESHIRAKSAGEVDIVQQDLVTAMAGGDHNFNEQEILGMLMHEIKGVSNRTFGFVEYAFYILPDCEIKFQFEEDFRKASKKYQEARDGPDVSNEVEMLDLVKLCSKIILDDKFFATCKDFPMLTEEFEIDKMFATIMLFLVESYEKGDLFGLKNKEKVEIKYLLTALSYYSNLSNSMPNVELSMPPDDVYIIGSSLAIWVLIDNFLRNAQFALGDMYKGTKPYPKVAISLKVVDGWAVIEVSDKGSGIKKEDLLKIFEPYFTTKGTAGTGLGLAICKYIAENHGGTIEVQSRHFSEYPDDHGATFTVRLPVAVDTAALAAGAPAFVAKDLVPAKSDIEQDL